MAGERRFMTNLVGVWCKYACSGSGCGRGFGRESVLIPGGWGAVDLH